MSWLAGKMIARSMKAIREGDMTPTTALYAEDVKFRFPGKNSFAPGAEGKAALEEWLGRFIRLGLQIYPDEVALTGWPWKQTISVRGHVLPRRSAGRPRLREPLRHLGPHALGEDARIRGLRGHRTDQGPRRLARAHRQGGPARRLMPA